MQPTASIVLSLAGNRKLSEETVAGAIGIRNPRRTCGVQNVSVRARKHVVLTYMITWGIVLSPSENIANADCDR